MSGICRQLSKHSTEGAHLGSWLLIFAYVRSARNIPPQAFAFPAETMCTCPGSSPPSPSCPCLQLHSLIIVHAILSGRPPCGKHSSLSAVHCQFTAFLLTPTHRERSWNSGDKMRVYACSGMSQIYVSPHSSFR